VKLRDHDSLARGLSDPKVRLHVEAALGLAQDNAALATGARSGEPARALGAWRLVDYVAGSRYTRIHAFGTGPASDYDWAAHDGFAQRRSAAHRCVLLGESVARGFHFDPSITPAHALQSALGTETEVIDLACVALHPGRRYEDLVDGVSRLEPTELVLMAGNNWSCTVWENTGAQETLDLAGAISSGLEAHCSFIRRRVCATARRTVEYALERARATGFRLVLVLPGFNLLDWHYERLTPRWLPRGDLRAWISLRTQVERLIETSSDRAIPLLKQMLALDGGCLEITNEWLARALLKQGDGEGAKHHFEKARDAGTYSDGFAVPRCPGYVLDELRCLGEENEDLHLVDLPRLFEAHSPGGIPGRDLFADYCHLSPKGMALAMGAVSAKLRALRGDKAVADASRAWSESAEETQGYRSGCLVAAIHNARSSQSHELVKWWLDKALTRAPQRHRMIDTALGTELNLPGGALIREIGCADDPVLDVYLKATRPSSNNELYLLSAIGEVVKAHSDTRAVMAALAKRAGRLLKPGPSLDVVAARMTRFRSCDRSEKVFHDCMFSRSLSPDSCFAFQADPGEYTIEVVARTPQLQRGEGEVTVSIDGALIGRFPAQREWGTYAFRTNMPALASELHELAIAWVEAEPQDHAGERRVAEDFVMLPRPRFHVVYGDVAAIRLLPV
jgi:hypothetical protein